MASWTSPPASARTLPISRTISSVSSSLRSTNRCATRKRISPRRGAGRQAPAVVGLLRGLDRAVDVVAGGARERPDRLTGRGVGGVERLVAGGVHPLAADVVLRSLCRCGRHLAPCRFSAVDSRLRTVPTVGDKASRTRLVRAEDIELFTELTGDRNPLHYDEERGRALALRRDHRPGRRHERAPERRRRRGPPRPGQRLPARGLELQARRCGRATRSPPRSRCSRRARTSRSRRCARRSPTRRARSSSTARRSYGPSRSTAARSDPGAGAPRRLARPGDDARGSRRARSFRSSARTGASASTAAAWLTIAVQLGFVAGALVSAS